MPLPSGNKSLTLGVELLAAADAYARKHNLTLSDLVRQAVAAKIGRKDLAGVVKMGRPPKMPATK